MYSCSSTMSNTLPPCAITSLEKLRGTRIKGFQNRAAHPVAILLCFLQGWPLVGNIRDANDTHRYRHPGSMPRQKSSSKSGLNDCHLRMLPQI